MSRIAARAGVLALSICCAFAAQAGDDGFSYHLSGFGTIGYAQSNSNDVLFTNPAQSKGADKGGSALLDSRLGGQVNMNFGQNVGATVQAIALQDARGDFRPRLEWAFVRYNLSSDITVRAGRLGWPAYLVSDFRYVGYANTWVRPPVEVYDLAELDNFDGADISWSHSVGPGYLTLKALGGHATNSLPLGAGHSATLRVNQLVGAYATYEIGNLRVRGGISSGKVDYTTPDLDSLFGGLQMAGYGNLVQSLALRNARTNFISLGAHYDAHNVVLTGEYADRRSASFLGHTHGWYGTFGYRLGNVMPYVTWAGYSKRSDANRYAVPAVGPLLPLSVGVAGIVGSNGQHTASLGARWDVHDNVALKFQFDHIMPAAAGGDFSNVQPGFNGHAVNVVSVVADFVF